MRDYRAAQFELVSYSVGTPDSLQPTEIEFVPSLRVKADVRFSIVSRFGGAYLNGQKIDLGSDVLPENRLTFYVTSVFQTPESDNHTPADRSIPYLNTVTDQQMYQVSDNDHLSSAPSLNLNALLDLNPPEAQIGRYLHQGAFFTVKLSWSTKSFEKAIDDSVMIPKGSTPLDWTLDLNEFAELRLPVHFKKGVVK
ncbi:hypothetical protein [Schleiferilactobacillus harbinensis]|uniref:hypothetical protein n=1 Tax=Schleiferilactobacillus harbinensis TaxID=304207 RepID=UPI0039EAF1C7